jgi:hypothetical protein
MTTEPLLRAIAGLTAALVAQDSATDETVAARDRLVRQAIREGHTMTAIGDASGITRQRVAQLAKRESNR